MVLYFFTYKSEFGEEDAMNIRISIKSEHNESILEAAMSCISRVAKGEPEWEKYKSYGGYEAECDVSEDEILPVFNELITKYPELDIFATYSEDIREDDSSAQWWRTTRIETEHHPDGTSTLDISSSTYWF